MSKKIKTNISEISGIFEVKLKKQNIMKKTLMFIPIEMP
jgi:hypothetical protein